MAIKKDFCPKQGYLWPNKKDLCSTQGYQGSTKRTYVQDRGISGPIKRTYVQCRVSVAPQKRICVQNRGISGPTKRTYRSGTVNSNTVNLKFHLIRIFCKVSVNIFSIILCLKCTVNSNFHLIHSKQGYRWPYKKDLCSKWGYQWPHKRTYDLKFF